MTGLRGLCLNALGAFLVLIVPPLFAGAPPTDPIRLNTEGVAIDGYSPVSYFTDGMAVKGSPEFAAEHDGAIYWLTSTDQQALFAADPDEYVPAHGGWCTLMMGGSGNRAPASPESFAIVDGRLMLFWSGDTEETKGLGLRNWASKTGGSPEKEAKWVEKADRQWAEFLAGSRKSPIYLYKPGDAEAVSDAQREVARVQY